jgi:DUF1680 family protein
MKTAISMLVPLTLTIILTCLAAKAETSDNDSRLKGLPLADAVRSAVEDKQDFQRPDCIVLQGMIGTRIDVNATTRLLNVDIDRLLEGFRRRPGRQEWDGEHIGKWIHAATLTWVHTGNAELRAKLDRAVTELVKCQLDDGYLGTYLPKDNWTEWDVWVHKYNLIGLITYIRYTGNREPLPACRKMADLLCNVFGEGEGKRDIIQAGHHVGMAPSSVLEPMVLLYRLTGEKRYRDFCEYILRAWEQPNGPHIVSRLLDGKRVDKVGNAKSYEMLSCINGMLEWYRTVGDPKLLEAALNAWQDIVDKRLYLTGTASYGEHFHDDFDLQNNRNTGENCVTVTWLQFNAQLLRLTGEARFAQQLEGTIYNHLFASQRPTGEDWCYYTGLDGKKPYSGKLEVNCCQSSGPRGVALIPTFAATTDADGLVVNLYDAGKAHLRLRSKQEVKLAIETQYPTSEKIVLTVDPSAVGQFALKLRIPDWCKSHSIAVNGKTVEAKTAADGYAVIQNQWNPGDKVELTLKFEARLIVGDHVNQGKVAIAYGPLVLAADEDLLGGTGKDLASVVGPAVDETSLNVKVESAPDRFKNWPDAKIFRIKATAPAELPLVPFANAGMTGAAYQIWLPAGSK